MSFYRYICFGAHNNRLNETVLLSTHNIFFGWDIRKLFFYYSFIKGSMNMGNTNLTPCRWQLKTLIPSTNVDENSLETVFDCHLSPNWRQMTIENTV